MQAIFRAQGPLSRHAISEMSGLTLSSVCGRVNELIDMGFLVVVGEVYDSATKRKVVANTEGVVFKGQTVTWARAMRGMV